MRGLFFDGAKAMLRDDLPEPQPGAGESLLSIELATVCPEDKALAVSGGSPFSGVMGRAFVARVLSSSDPALEGKRVVGERAVGCGVCEFCRAGRASHCADRQIPGLVGRDGCFAERMAFPTGRLHLLPDGLSEERALFCEPLSAALALAEQHHLRPSMSAAVVGEGRLAYLTAQVLALTGMEVTAVGSSADKLAPFAPYAKTTTTADGAFDVVVEASDEPSGIETAQALTRPGGLLVIRGAGILGDGLRLHRLAAREVMLSGSRFGPAEPALRLLARGLVTVPRMELLPLERWEEAFARRAFQAGFDFRESEGGQ